jgi:hypothetical protein
MHPTHLLCWLWCEADPAAKSKAKPAPKTTPAHSLGATKGTAAGGVYSAGGAACTESTLQGPAKAGTRATRSLAERTNAQKDAEDAAASGGGKCASPDTQVSGDRVVKRAKRVSIVEVSDLRLEPVIVWLL